MCPFLIRLVFLESFSHPKSTSLDPGVESDQLKTLAHIGLFENYSEEDFNDSTPELPSWDDVMQGSSDLNVLAKAYLHANCSFCHQPGGPGLGPEDFRFSTPLSEMNVCDRDPTVSDLGIQNAKLLKPGNPDASILFQRLNRRDEHGMPPIGSRQVDAKGATLISDWIHSINSCEFPD